MAQQVLYDLTELPDIADLLRMLQTSYSFEIKTGKELATQRPEAIVGHLLLLSDDYFGNKSDAEILQSLAHLAKYGVLLLYIGVTRDEEFAQRLNEIGVYPHLVHELTEEDIVNFLSRFLDRLDPSIEHEPEEEDDDHVILIPPATKATTASRTAISHPVSLHKQETDAINDSFCIVVSGAPGAGTTFVGLNLATVLSQPIHYVEAGLRPCLTTWLGAEEEEAHATLATPLHPAVVKGKLSVFTRDPFGEETVNLRQVADAISQWDTPTILDVALQDYLATLDHPFANQTLRILVTTGDLHRCRYLEGVPADVVVINQVSSPLPIDEEEFQTFWPDVPLIFVPYEVQQGIAVTQGQAVVGLSDAIHAAMNQLNTARKGGKSHATHLA
jgi:hypothetical protein